MALVSDAKIARLRAKLDRKVLVHTYTRAPQTTPTDDDAWGEKDAGSGTTTTAVACVYGGVTIVTVPALTVSASDPLAIGDRVSNVTDQLGGVLLVGPARVESLLEARGAELGASLQYVYELRVGTVSG
jgi:hypothetical protein